MASAQVLPSRREVLIDERGDSLQATWHPGQRIVVLSEWRSGSCRATFRLAPAEAASLAAFLVAVLGDAATSRSPAGRARAGLFSRIGAWLRGS